MTTTWHVDPVELDAYLADRIGVGAAASIEAHLLTCDACRRLVVPSMPATELDASWHRLERRIDDTVESNAERAVRSAGLGDADARLLVSTPTLRGSWLIAIGVTLLSAAVIGDLRAAASGDLATLIFLTIAPLAPLLGVAAAFGPETDPSYEVALAAPMSRLRLLAVRATAVFVTSAVIGVASGLALPGPSWQATLWLLPALVLSLVTVALPTSRSPLPAVAGLGVTWVAIVTTWVSISGDRLAPFRGGAQLIYLVAASVVAGAIVATRDHEHPTALVHRRMR